MLQDGLAARALAVSVESKWRMSFSKHTHSCVPVQGKPSKRQRKAQKRAAKLPREAGASAVDNGEQKTEQPQTEPATEMVPLQQQEHYAYYCKLRVEIDVGRYHVVRRLLSAVGLPVDSLARTAVGPLHLHELSLPNPGKPSHIACATFERGRVADCRVMVEYKVIASC